MFFGLWSRASGLDLFPRYRRDLAYCFDRDPWDKTLACLLQTRILYRPVWRYAFSHFVVQIFHSFHSPWTLIRTKSSSPLAIVIGSRCVIAWHEHVGTVSSTLGLPCFPICIGQYLFGVHVLKMGKWSRAQGSKNVQLTIQSCPCRSMASQVVFPFLLDVHFSLNFLLKDLTISFSSFVEGVNICPPKRDDTKQSKLD